MRTNIRIRYILIYTFILTIAYFIFCNGCKKLIQIGPPTNSITTSQVFVDSFDADAAVAGIYSSMSARGAVSFGSSAITIYCGSSADELLPFNSVGDKDQFSRNTLKSTNGSVNTYFWTQAYRYIYQANAIIEGLQMSTSISQSAKNQFTGEAKFFRALFYFYLTNLFGDVPLLTSTDYRSNSLAVRATQDQVYQLIIDDLKDAQGLLAGDYSAGNGEKIRANKWAATALLARVYLYKKNWADAEAQATDVIENAGIFTLVNNLDSVFLANSSEAILQWQLNTSFSPYNATTEGYNLVPSSPTRAPFYYLSSQLLNGFESGDQRRVSWLNTTTYQGKVYYYPYKYKIGPGKTSANATPTEYYMVLRLAEQYLIRAEARAQQNTNLNGAISDLNTIRIRASLPPIANVDQDSVIRAVVQERRIELFAEWGHRWLDLKRTNQANAILPSISIKSTWQPYQQLYPIPFSEMQADPNLKQNTGYTN